MGPEHALVELSPRATWQNDPEANQVRFCTQPGAGVWRINSGA